MDKMFKELSQQEGIGQQRLTFQLKLPVRQGSGGWRQISLDIKPRSQEFNLQTSSEYTLTKMDSISKMWYVILQFKSII